MDVIVRLPSPTLATAKIKTGGVGIPDFERAFFQHQQLCDALEKCGAKLTVLGADRDFPFACFVGSTVVATEYLCIVANPGVDSTRQGEQQEAAKYLAPTKFVKFVKSPGRADAGDVVRVGEVYFVGTSDVTNGEGAAQVAYFLKESGHAVTVLNPDLDDMPVLSAGLCNLGGGNILIREELAKHYAFMGFDMVKVAGKDRAAINSVLVNGTLVMPAGHARVADQVRALGVLVIETPVSEFEKMGLGIGQLMVTVPKPATVADHGAQRSA